MENVTKNQTVRNEKEMFEADQSATNSECSDDDNEIDADNEIDDEMDYNDIIGFHYNLFESIKKKIIINSLDLFKLKEETIKTMDMINYLVDRSNTLNKRFLERMKQDKIDEDTLNLKSKQILKMIRNLCS